MKSPTSPQLPTQNNSEYSFLLEACPRFLRAEVLFSLIARLAVKMKYMRMIHIITEKCMNEGK
ncbi:hypothetical protein EJB10_04895 [Wolbachia endosymbiont of Brugia malayi]|uniref:hypothetical protein n=1 Tax=Wolbachia endosymbiont of Brugia malayi TaxID=80849 RepID=UPI00004C93E9|nr:hypothetical protein [Wolbachia endosymbiont of Brugia malayi]AAW71065.1 Predicted protein [Wolbachia endosymbiont strain TRS of Brugia malayi]QCB62010.1 hypothetical protein EJB10_04895 [Wolbachia endosymbiont of Brugia malayi]